MFQSDH